MWNKYKIAYTLRILSVLQKKKFFVIQMMALIFDKLMVNC